MKKLPLRNLGKSDLLVSPIGLGCWQFSKGNGIFTSVWPVLDDNVIQKIVNETIKGGINFFDTAEVYGWGESEKALSRALLSLNKRSGDVVIATKWWPFFRFASSIKSTISQRQEALSGFPIDLYQVHQPYSMSSIKSQMDAMADLVKSGKVRHIGVSNFSEKRMRRSHKCLMSKGLNLISNQVQYNLLDRRIECNGILDAARELGIAIIAYSPLAQGLLTGKFHDDPGLIKERGGLRKYLPAFNSKGLEKSRPVILLLKELAHKYRVTPAQIALNWLIEYNRGIVFVIPGATTEKQAYENTGALDFKLHEDDVNRIDAVSARFKH
jgi:aryl-alcohol dehydrogenase-like predicted oxidoreductase